MKNIGTMIWPSLPEGGTVVFAIIVLIIIYIIFFKGK